MPVANLASFARFVFDAGVTFGGWVTVWFTVMGAPNRPGIAIGHLSVLTPDLDATLVFFETLRARSVFQREGLAILEVRGGTHLIVRAGEAGTPSFDLMVDDVDAAHASLRGAGFEPSPVADGRIHRSFSVRDGAGIEHRLTSSHAVGPV